MEQLALIKQMAGFIAALLGEDAEVVVHDMATGRIVWIANGHITGREAGETEPTAVIRLLADRAKELGSGQLVGYPSKNHMQKNLRSSSLFLRDEQGRLSYALCVNQDISALCQLNQQIAKLIQASPLEKPPAETGSATIENVTLNIIMEEIEKAKPFSLDSREAKITILRRLDEKGVFEVRRAVPKVCETLQIAQATLYKYLREIKSGEKNNAPK